MKKVFLFFTLCVLSLSFLRAGNESPIWQTSTEGPVYSYEVEPGMPRKYYDNGGPERNMRSNFALTIVQLKPALSNHHITVVFEEMDMGNDLLKFYNGAIELYNGPDEDGEYRYDWPKDVKPIYELKGNPEKLPLVISSTDPTGALSVANMNLSDTKGWVATVYCVKNGDPEPGGVKQDDKGDYEFSILSDLGQDADGEDIDEATINLSLKANADNTVVQIDWGDGVKRDYTILKAGEPSSITENVDAGATVKIFGDPTMIDLTGNKVVNSFRFNKKDNVPAIQKLGLSSNKIDKLFLNNMTNLKDLAVSNNKLSEINLSHLENLEEFYGAYNPYKELRTAMNTKLQVLTCYNTGISQLDLSNNKMLKVLTAGDNKYEIVPSLLNNTELTSLDFENIGLEKIDLSSLVNLTRIVLSKNQLSNIDLSKNTKLSDINLVGNQMDACAINDVLFGLPNNDSKENYIIRIAGNAGASLAETDLAELNGWKIDTKGNGEGCSTIRIKFVKNEHGTFRTKVGTEDFEEMKPIVKGSMVNVVASPAENYELSKIIYKNKEYLVDKDEKNKVSFEPDTYGSLAAVFVDVTSVDEIDRANVTATRIADGYQIKGLTPGTAYAVYDMNGHVVAQGVADADGLANVRMDQDIFVFKSKGVVIKMMR